MRTALKFALCLTLLALAWSAPADPITGKWDFSLDTPGGERRITANFELKDEKVTGKWGPADVEGTFKDGKLSLAFPFTSEEVGVTATMKIEGKLDGEAITGTWAYSEYDGTFKATPIK